MNTTISTRLTAPLIAVSLLMLALAGGAAWYVHNLQQQSTEIITNHVASVRAAYEIEINVREMRRQLFRFLFDGDRSHLAQTESAKERADEWLEVAERLSTTPDEMNSMASVRNAYDRFTAIIRERTATAPEPDAFQVLRDPIEKDLLEGLFRPLEEFQKVNESKIAANYEKSRQLAGNLILGLVGLGVCGAGGGLLMGWAIASSVRRSLYQTEERLLKTARQLDRRSGDTESSAETRFSGELDTAMNRVSVSVAAVLARLDRSERDALRAEQLAQVGQMAAGIAHEVRNPLMSMKILVQNAVDQPPGETLRPRDLRVLEDEIERVESIITHFLDFARPPQIDKQVRDVTQLVERVVCNLEARAAQRKVIIEIDPGVESIKVDVDAGQFQQVLYNLVINAIEVIPDGGRVTVQLGREQKHPKVAPQLIVRVKDTGPGLPAALGERIFEPFVSARPGGMGLGLSICRRIVEAHGGDLRGANGIDGGAVFTLRMPAAVQPAPVLTR